MFDRLRAWLAKPLLAKAQAAHELELTGLRAQIPMLQHQAYITGRAHGEQIGHGQACVQMEEIIEEKRYPESSQGDIDRMRKGRAH